MSSAGGGGGGLPEFFFFIIIFFSVQQTTSGIGHRVSSFFGLATNTLNVRNNKNNNVNVGQFPDRSHSNCVLRTASNR